MNTSSQDARDEHRPAVGSQPGRTLGGSWPGPPPTDVSYPSPYAGPRRSRRRRRAWWVGAGALVVAASMGAGVTVGATALGPSGPAAVAPNGAAGNGSGGTGAGGTRSGDTGVAARLPRATRAQEVGVVDIDTLLAYQGADAAGTGMVLTSTGEVLTNNHVIDGATSIKVTVVATGTSYSATVVGTDPTQDVAVLRLRGASGLKTVRTDSSAATIAESVTGVGNAGGMGGIPSAAGGKVTATGQTITASDQGGSNPETLHGMIQDGADIQAGDSGGPLENTVGQVVGMDTAAATTRSAAGTTGYAIPIGTALEVAHLIESGRATGAVHLGYPAFLGVALTSDQPVSRTGAVVQQVLSNTPAAQTGMTAGDVITAIGTHRVHTSGDLQSTLAGYRPGQQVTVTWTDLQGRSRTATVTLAAGPAD